MRIAYGQTETRAGPQLVLALLITLLMWCQVHAGLSRGADPKTVGTRAFLVNGIVKEIRADGTNVLISHEAVAGYMDAMTMPFKVREPKELAGLRLEDKVRFRLLVSESESWIDQIVRTGAAPPAPATPIMSRTERALPEKSPHPLLTCLFTNELGHAVRLSDFRGQALAITFFFTRCPLPDFCPRLSRNFQEASRKLIAMTNAPTNWHFLSVTFDPEHDTPPALKAYAESYQYDPQHWSFLTGPNDRLAALAAESGVLFERDGAFFNHNIRTLIIDAAGHLQMVFPTSGDLSDSIVSEMLKADGVTHSAKR